jgi:O-antigen/teichoic acid export membrane protein
MRLQRRITMVSARQEPPMTAVENRDQGSGVRHARTVSLLMVAELAGKVASFAMFAVAARVLGPDQFGQFSWALNLALLVSVFTIWGFDTALIQLASASPARLDRLLSDLLAIRTLLVPPALALVAVLAGGSLNEIAVCVVMAMAVLADGANQAVRSAAGVLSRQRSVAVNLVVQRLLTVALAVTVLLAGGGVPGMALAYLAGTLVGVVLMLVSGRRIGLRPSFRLVTLEGMRELVGASHALGLSNTLNMLAFRVDMLLLGWLLGGTAVGTYSVAYKMFETALFFLWSLERVALPTIAATQGPESVRLGVHRVSSAMFAVYLPYAVIVAIRGEQILRVLFGEQYGTASLGALQLLMAALIPYSLQYLICMGLLSRSRNRAVTTSGAIAAVVNVLANLALIPLYGPTGAAAATFVAMAAQSAFVWVVLSRMVGSPHLLRASLVPGLAVLATVPILLSGMGLITAICLAAVVYVGVWILAAGRFDPIARRTVLGLAGISG